MHPYKTLNVSLSDDSETVRKAYLYAVRSHPPESDPVGFQRINEAYELIKTEDSRLKREIGIKPSKSTHLSSPMEAAVAFLKSDVDPTPPEEDAFYTFLRS
jgi:curved DNA-binding protein CbpA